MLRAYRFLILLSVLLRGHCARYSLFHAGSINTFKYGSNHLARVGYSVWTETAYQVQERRKFQGAWWDSRLEVSTLIEGTR